MSIHCNPADFAQLTGSSHVVMQVVLPSRLELLCWLVLLCHVVQAASAGLAIAA